MLSGFPDFALRDVFLGFRVWLQKNRGLNCVSGLRLGLGLSMV